jgi:hypothetical protein
MSDTRAWPSAAYGPIASISTITMDFTGRLYFDFISPDVFRVHQLLARAEGEGVSIGLQWRGLPSAPDSTDRSALAASEMVRTMAPDRYGAFVQTVLVGVHLEHMRFEGDGLLEAAARAAGIDGDVVSATRIGTVGEALLQATEKEAAGLGVKGVPSIYRHGPVVRVRTTPAIVEGPASPRIELIAAVLDDDGLWELSKP